LNLKIIPFIKKQELRTAVNYWEGAVDVKAIGNGKELQGKGYVELTGYSSLNE